MCRIRSGKTCNLRANSYHLWLLTNWRNIFPSKWQRSILCPHLDYVSASFLSTCPVIKLLLYKALSDTEAVSLVLERNSYQLEVTKSVMPPVSYQTINGILMGCSINIYKDNRHCKHEHKIKVAYESKFYWDTYENGWGISGEKI